MTSLWVGWIDDLDDMNCTIDSKLFQIKKLVIGYVVFTFHMAVCAIVFTIYMTQWLREKGSEATDCVLEPRSRLYTFHILYRKLQKLTCQKYFDVRSKGF